MNKTSEKDWRDDLPYFTGTENWSLWSPIFKTCLLTDGARYVAEEGSAYWLMDLIGSYQSDYRKRGQSFQVWDLYVAGSTAYAKCTDGNDNELSSQHIEHTDFPEPGIRLYAIYDGEYTVILLPSEY